MSLTKEQIEASVAHFNAILEQKAGPPENRWSEADQMLAKSLIANGYDHVSCMRTEKGGNFVIGIGGPKGNWAFFSVGDVFPDLMEGESIELQTIAEMRSEKITRKEKKMSYKKFKDIPRLITANYAVDYPLPHLVKWIEREQQEAGLQLNPDFQRGHVWTEMQQIAYIEFLLRGGKTGRDVYLNNPEWHHKRPESDYKDYVCVDGLQRITAISKFINNAIPVFGTLYKDFEDKLSSIHDTIRVHINDLPTKRDVLQWYIEMNEGGTPHSKEEIERVKCLMNEDCDI